MARTRTTTTPRKPGIMERLRSRPARQQSKVTTKHSKNPITGSRKTTRTTETHGAGHGGHGGRHPMTSNSTPHHTTTPVQHHRRKPSVGDKVAGAMLKMKGSLTRKPGLKAAGTRRMHGTDGRNARRV
ncbi:hypothetical protein LTR37_002271 [Vermiconidia calcicola]|uniref:Uncharacterized protein n=1 Tax=Vermiconidia calcicola TaxID=1690605 RepID=A0ACC3NT70_9PEZI|nr:hypothetical protein LTR37_002271 [Vermiconidia calcicola]